jgi:putative sugar O-methyltransferase
MYAALKARLEESIQVMKENDLKTKQSDVGDWEGFQKEFIAVVDKAGRLIDKNLQSFRGLSIGVWDEPRVTIRNFHFDSSLWRMFLRILYVLRGRKRGAVKEAHITFRVLEEKGYLHLLEKYPNPSVGKPFNINYRGYRFTNRYLRQIYLVGMFNEHVAPLLPEDPIIMDIGASYGLFSSLVKQEHPKSRHVLVDMPIPLLIAHYYLQTLFPSAKIAGFKEVANIEKIDRKFIESYDFVLLPISMYEKLEGESVDLVTNFVSFAEMSPEWFWRYFDSAPVLTAPLLFTVNRYDSHPTYSNNFTVLDYPLDRYEAIYMRKFPILLWCFKSYAFFGCRKARYPSEFFQFVGRQSNSMKLAKMDKEV